MVTLNRLSSISIPSPYTIEGFRNEGHALFFADNVETSILTCPNFILYFSLILS